MASLVYKHSSYYAVFSVGAKKRWVKIGSVEKREARRILKKLEIEFTKDRLNLIDTKEISLYEFIDGYWEYAITNKAKSTCIRESGVIKALKSHFKNISLSKIDNQLIEGYKAMRLQHDGLMPSSINKELSVLRFMLNKAKEWNYL